MEIYIATLRYQYGILVKIHTKECTIYDLKVITRHHHTTIFRTIQDAGLFTFYFHFHIAPYIFFCKNNIALYIFLHSKYIQNLWDGSGGRGVFVKINLKKGTKTPKICILTICVKHCLLLELIAHLF